MTSSKANIVSVTPSLLGISVLVFVLGLFQLISRTALAKNNTDPTSVLPFKTSLTERDVAIAAAIKEGKTEYSFTSNFTPGIGRIVNPDQYLQDWKKSQEQKLP